MAILRLTGSQLCGVIDASGGEEYVVWSLPRDLLVSAVSVISLRDFDAAQNVGIDLRQGHAEFVSASQFDSLVPLIGNQDGDLSSLAVHAFRGNGFRGPVVMPLRPDVLRDGNVLVLKFDLTGVGGQFQASVWPSNVPAGLLGTL